MREGGTHRENFEAWYGRPLTTLMNDPDAGFVIAMAGMSAHFNCPVVEG